MLAFPSMIARAAEQAGMKTPNFDDYDEYDPEEFPHFHVFCLVQLGRRMNDLGEHWENAKVIAEIPDDEIKTISLAGILNKGLSFSS